MGNFKQYLKTPEMRILWVFLFLMLIVLVIDFIFLTDPFWLVISGIILLSIGVIIFFANIRAAKSNLLTRLEKERLDRIVSTISDGIVVYDLQFKIMIFNRAAEEIFNVSKENIVGKTIVPESVRSGDSRILAQVIYPSLAPTVIRRSPEEVYPQIMDMMFSDPDLELRVTTTRLVGDNGQVFGFLKIVRDRTREVELLKSKSDFATVAAHQLRTPLTAVSWALESLDKENLKENQKELVQTGLSASNNLMKIIEDLLDVAKMEEGKFGYDFQDVDIIKFIQSVLSDAQPVARMYKVNLYFQPTENSLIIHADPRRLGVVFSNLLNNAIKYNVSGGQVTVSLDRLPDKPFVQINVADTGIGIPPEETKNLFNKFFRASNVMTVETSGSGLGLYIAKNVIRRHGGEIWAESALGRGTAVHFTLPTDRNLVPNREIVYGEE